MHILFSKRKFELFKNLICRSISITKMLFINRLSFLFFFVSLSYQAFKFEVNKGKNNPFGRHTQSQLSKPTNIVINPEDIGRYINQIRTAPSMLIPLL